MAGRMGGSDLMRGSNHNPESSLLFDPMVRVVRGKAVQGCCPQPWKHAIVISSNRYDYCLIASLRSRFQSTSRHSLPFHIMYII